mmetsp:Transcript_7388/g.17787  ORF Transcript_7388/g.17787 Transcript_7388/m.17787 type:complete len:129 (-) Transcript_7388:192-578(-)|eukprot:g11088.t1
MPLVNVYLGPRAPRFSSTALRQFHDFLAGPSMFGVPFGILQLNVVRAEEMYPDSNVFLSIRCKGTPERTPEKMKQIQTDAGKWLLDRQDLGYTGGKTRSEVFNPQLQLAVSFGEQPKEETASSIAAKL